MITFEEFCKNPLGQIYQTQMEMFEKFSSFSDLMKSEEHHKIDFVNGVARYKNVFIDGLCIGWLAGLNQNACE